MLVHANTILAEPGSVGGTIGKQGKTVSGGNEKEAAPNRATSGETSSPCLGLVGVWSWSTGGETTIKPGGTLSKGELTGTWTCKGGQVVIVWKHGYVDQLSLSARDGHLTGKNQLGFTISGNRKNAN
jgi:hypothetical protein